MKRVLDLIDALIGGVVAVLFAAALGLSLMGVAGRYVSSRLGLDWITEVVIFLVIWAVLLGAARVVRRGAHIRVDFLVERFSARGRRLAELFALVLALGVSGFLVWSGWQVVEQSVLWGETSISSLRIPLWLYYAALPTSFGLQLLFIAERTADLCLGRTSVAAPDLSD